MCNSYLIRPKRSAKGLAERVSEATARLASDLVRKSDPGVVVRTDGRVEVMRWGFRRSFNPSINSACSDKLEGGMWKDAFHTNRCVIPMSRFYEWGPGSGGRKQAHEFGDAEDDYLCVGNALAETPLPQPPKKTLVHHAVVDLTDGSRIVGTPLEKSLPVTLSYANPTVPLEVITRCEIKHSPESAALFLQNGDHISGTLGADTFPLDTILGRLSPKFIQIERIELSVKSTGSPTEGKGDITFGGVKWEAWRTCFEQQGRRLMSLPAAREGFNYGHSGNGRGAQLTTNIGEKDWTDYRIEVDFCMTGIDPAFNPHGLPQDYRSGGIMFQLAAATESWNVAPGTTCYSMNLSADGSWNLGCIYDNESMGWIGNFSATRL